MIEKIQCIRIIINCTLLISVEYNVYFYPFILILIASVTLNDDYLNEKGSWLWCGSFCP